MAQATTVFDTVSVDIAGSSEVVFLICFVMFLNRGNGVCFRNQNKNKLETMWVFGWWGRGRNRKITFYSGHDAFNEDGNTGQWAGLERWTGCSIQKLSCEMYRQRCPTGNCKGIQRRAEQRRLGLEVEIFVVMYIGGDKVIKTGSVFFPKRVCKPWRKEHQGQNLGKMSVFKSWKREEEQAKLKLLTVWYLWETNIYPCKR